MAIYTYKGRDQTGALLTGLVEAPNERAAVKLLREKQVLVTSLVEKRQGFSLSVILSRFKQVGFNDVVDLTRQLSTMVTAGLTLPEALTILRNQTKNPQIRSDGIRISLTLCTYHSSAQEKHPEGLIKFSSGWLTRWNLSANFVVRFAAQ